MRLAYRGADFDLSKCPAATQKLASWVSDNFAVEIGSSIRPTDPYPDHRRGEAVDLMTGDKSVHDWICAALIEAHNQGRCRIRSIISWGRRWTLSAGWGPYRGSYPHRDHVHVWLDSRYGFDGIDDEKVGPEAYPLAGERRGGKPCYYGNRRGPAHWVGGYHAKDRDEIRKIQASLRQRGHMIQVDGIFGPATESAVKAFQAEAGLAVDGLVGPQTWAKLVS